jgi:hypothetical protein
MRLNKIKVTSVMVGRNPRYEVDIMILQSLQENSQLRYIDIQENINLRCEHLGLKNLLLTQLLIAWKFYAKRMYYIKRKVCMVVLIIH